MKLVKSEIVLGNKLKYTFDREVLTSDKKSLRQDVRDILAKEVTELRKQLGLDIELDYLDLAELGLFWVESWGTLESPCLCTTSPFFNYKIEDFSITYTLDKEYEQDIKAMFNIFESDDEIGGYCNPESDWEDCFI